MKRIITLLVKAVALVFVIGAAGLALSRLLTMLHAWQRTYPLEDAPSRGIAIVFGAGIRRDGTPTPVLRDRVETAANLYQQGKVQKLLMSGDNRTIEYNEPAAMRDYAVQLGVPEGDIVLDYAGQSTYDTCYRARAIFQVSDAILVTQGFHLPRALYTCNALGVEAVGVPADRRTYRTPSHVYWNVRELVATANAFWEIYVSHPQPILGKAEPIPVQRVR